MHTNSLLSQQSARGLDPGPLHDNARTQDAPTDTRRPPFDGLTIGLHWTTVLIVLALFGSAWLHALAESLDSKLTPALLQTHRSLGMTIWAVTAFRLAWRLTRASLPAFPAQMTKLHRITVKWSEYGLYALLLGQPVTGLLTTLLGGRPFALFFWQISPLMPRDEMLRTVFHLSHDLGAWALAALTVSHAAAALYHHFVLRDDVLSCMAPALAMARRRHTRATARIVPAGNVVVE